MSGETSVGHRGTGREGLGQEKVRRDRPGRERRRERRRDGERQADTVGERQADTVVAETLRQRKVSMGKRGSAVLRSLIPEVLRRAPSSTARVLPLSPSSSPSPASLSTPPSLESVSTRGEVEAAVLSRLSLAAALPLAPSEQQLWRSSSEQGQDRGLSLPPPLPHSTSDETCHHHSARRKGHQGRPKRRSMSDYQDLKEATGRTPPQFPSTRITPAESTSERSLSSVPGPAVPKCGREVQREEAGGGGANSGGGANCGSNNGLRSKMAGIRNRLSLPLQQHQSGSLPDSPVTEDEAVTAVKTRKTSADLFKSAVQRKVSTLSTLQAWKRKSAETKDSPESVGKPASNSLGVNFDCEKVKVIQEETKPKAPKLTLSVHKMTPIPSVDLDDYTPEPLTQEDGRAVEEPLAVVNLPETASGQSSAGSGSNQGRGILKKMSTVEGAEVEEVAEQRESEVRESVSSVNPTVQEATEARKDGLLARAKVKFEGLPSFDSGTSEELPEIVVDTVGDEEENMAIQINVTMYNEIDNGDQERVKEQEIPAPEDRAQEVGCVTDSFQPEAAVTLREVIEMVRQVHAEQRDLEVSDVPRTLWRRKRRYLKKLRNTLREVLRINAGLLEQGVDPEKDEETVTEEEEEEEEEEARLEEENVTTHRLVLPPLHFSCCEGKEVKVQGGRRRHSCPCILPRCSSREEDQGVSTFAQAFLCRYRGEEDEDEGLGLGLASPLPPASPPPTGARDSQSRDSQSRDSLVWDFQGLGRALLHARETDMV